MYFVAYLTLCSRFVDARCVPFCSLVFAIVRGFLLCLLQIFCVSISFMIGFES